MADRYESNQKDPDRKSEPDKSKQGDKQHDKGKSFRKGLSSAEVKQPQKTNRKEKRKFSGNCFVYGKSGHRALDYYRKSLATEAKGKANMAESGASLENE